MQMPKYVTRLDQVPQLSPEEREALRKVESVYAFRSNEYYLSLIDWNDPNDPIRRLIIPSLDELEDWGELDPSGEKHYIVAPGVEHKYERTAVFLASRVCGGICRVCFRKRLFKRRVEEEVIDWDAAFEYVRNHPEITNVLLTGGDPLMLATDKIRRILEELRAIEHVRIIRFGSKLPAFNPFRITEDPELVALFKEFSLPDKRIYLMSHFNHVRELTPQAVKAVELLVSAGVIICNQTPMIRGVTDDPEILARLFQELSFTGATPYYVFQNRPAAGNRTYVVPVERGYTVFEQAKTRVSGAAKRARYCMSHYTGKIAVVGLTKEHIIMKYHQARDPENLGRVMVFRRNPDALWFDDYTDMVESAKLSEI